MRGVRMRAKRTYMPVAPASIVPKSRRGLDAVSRCQHLLGPRLAVAHNNGFTVTATINVECRPEVTCHP